MTTLLQASSLLVEPGQQCSLSPNGVPDTCAPDTVACSPNTKERVLALSQEADELASKLEQLKSTGNETEPPSDATLVAGQCRLAEFNKFTLNPDEPQRSLAELVHALMEELEQTGKKDLNRLYNIMMSYDYAGNEWKRYEFVNPEKKYTRNLIANVPGSFCLMLLCWNGEKGSPIHNHAGSECFMRVLQGRLLEKQYIVRNGEGDQSASCNWNKIVCSNIPPSDLIKTAERVYPTGGCTFINDSLGVHQVENSFKELAISLHLYIPGYTTSKCWTEDAAATEECMKVKVQHGTISFDTEQGEQVHS